MKIVLYNKDTIVVNIICIVIDIISIFLLDINWIASVFLFVFSIVFDFAERRRIFRKKQNKKEPVRMESRESVLAVI